jgi:hypothetical protein
MNWLKRIPKYSVLLFAIWQMACGVKGDPMPPERPPSLGRSRPTYKRATEGLKIEKVPRKNLDDEEDEKDEDDDKE